MSSGPTPAIDLAAVRAELSPAVVSDVLDAIGLRQQCLGAGLRPLDPEQVLVGYAFPVHLQRVYGVPPEPFRGLVAALDAIKPDDVFVTPTQRAQDIAVWGELLSTACVARRAAGALTDGLIRDTRAVRRLGFPVISAGTIPYDSQGRHEIIAHDVACVIDGVRIEPGDLIVADADGAAIVPRDLIEQTIKAALLKRSSEREFRTAVSEGMLATEAFATFGVL